MNVTIELRIAYGDFRPKTRVVWRMLVVSANFVPAAFLVYMEGRAAWVPKEQAHGVTNLLTNSATFVYVDAIPNRECELTDAADLRRLGFEQVERKT